VRCTLSVSWLHQKQNGIYFAEYKTSRPTFKRTYGKWPRWAHDNVVFALQVIVILWRMNWCPPKQQIKIIGHADSWHRSLSEEVCMRSSLYECALPVRPVRALKAVLLSLERPSNVDDGGQELLVGYC